MPPSKSKAIAVENRVRKEKQPIGGSGESEKEILNAPGIVEIRRHDAATDEAGVVDAGLNVTSTSLSLMTCCANPVKPARCSGTRSSGMKFVGDLSGIEREPDARRRITIANPLVGLEPLNPVEEPGAHHRWVGEVDRGVAGHGCDARVAGFAGQPRVTCASGNLSRTRSSAMLCSRSALAPASTSANPSVDSIACLTA